MPVKDYEQRMMVLNLTRHLSKFQTLFCHLEHPAELRSWGRFASNLYTSMSSGSAFGKWDA